MIAGQQGDFRTIMFSDYPPVGFIGSGISTNCSDWTDLIHKLAMTASNNSDIERLRERLKLATDLESLLLIADDSLANIPPTELRDFMTREFGGNSEIPSVFNAIVRAPFTFYITTNYDCNIEDAFWQNRGRQLKVVTPERIEDALRFMRDNEPFVLKIHGCGRTGSEWVIGHEDYRRTIYENRRLRYVLAAILATRSIAFVGYGHRDPHITRYLDYERSVLPGGAMRRFTFVQKSDAHLAIRAYIRRQNVSRIEVDSWEDVEDILDQCTFMRIRDRYQRARMEFRHDYSLFVSSGRVDCAWGALMYAAAASDLGHAEDVGKICATVRENALARRRIKSSPSLEIAFHIVAGQLEKRAMNVEEAATHFHEAERLADEKSSILRPLRALALRYAGIFYLRPLGSGEKYRDLDKAGKLFERARDILGDEFPEEKLDVEKWYAILEVEKHGANSAAERLFHLANKADTLGYLKNGAWCRYGGAEQLLTGSPQESELGHIISELLKALNAFEKLQHPHGLAAVHYLLAAAKLRRENVTEQKTKTEIQDHLSAAEAMAVFCRNRHLQYRIRQLSSNI